MPFIKAKRRGLLLAAMALAVMVAGYYAYQIHEARNFTREVLIPRFQATSYPLQLKDLSPWQQEALLKVEDPGFHHHGGVDFSTPGQGITTLTQGLVKLLYFDKFQPGLAKLRQTLIAALVLDPLVSKQDQLLLFINLVPMGGQTRGLAEAAQAYYHKPFAELSQDEYLALVGTIIAPATFNPQRYPQRNQERVARIKKLLGGEYKPKGLMDLYYGPLDEETRQGLPPLSYFDSYYR
jgi:membrane peptidoglycan carboxypeptidase